MIDPAKLERAAAAVRKKFPKARPACGLILGSGWGDVISSFTIRGELPYAKIPGLGKTGVVGHAGRLLWASAAGIETLIFQGRRHYYEGAGWTPPAIPVFILKALGARTVVLTNAAGGIRKGMKPGDLMLITDHINLIGSSPLIGPHNPAFGPRFPDQSTVYSPTLGKLATKVFQSLEIPLHRGTYLAASGPAYETPAEIRAFAKLGADAVGMSTVPEAMLANAAGLRVAALSCITNLAAGISPTPLTHEEVTAATRAAMPRMTAVIAGLWKELAHDHDQT